MKKKILLSAFTMFSILIAGKSFAQSYHTTYVRNVHYTTYQEFRSDIRDVRHDQANINYDIRRIEEKKAEIRRDLALRKFYAYRQDQIELQRLERDLATDRRDLAMDMKDIRTDVRVATRF